MTSDYLTESIAAEVIDRVMHCDNKLIHDYLVDILRSACITSFKFTFKDGHIEIIRIDEE